MNNVALDVKKAVWKDVKVWVNELFGMNGKDLNRENLGELKRLLTMHKNKNYYKFSTNDQQEIVVAFSLGEVKIRIVNRLLEVNIDDSTKRHIYELRTNYQALQKSKSSLGNDIGTKPKTESLEPKHETTVVNIGIRNDPFDELASFSEESFGS